MGERRSGARHGGALLAAAAVSLPLMYGSARAAFQSVDARLEDAARTLGAGAEQVFAAVTVTHDREEAERLGDRLVFLRQGRVVGEEGSAGQAAR